MRRFIQIVLCFLVLLIVSLTGAEDGKKKEQPPIEEVLKQVPAEILELLKNTPEEENVKLPAIPDELKKALGSIGADSPDWEAYLALIGYKTGTETGDGSNMYKWIANDYDIMGAREYMKRRLTNETMRGLSSVYTDVCPKIPVDENEYMPLLNACLESECELKSRWGMSPHVGGMSGLALVFAYKQMPRFILNIGYPLRFQLGGGSGPYYNSISFYDLKQDLSIKKVVWVDQYEMLGEKADKAAIEFWEKLEIGVWIEKNNEGIDTLEEFMQGEYFNYLYIPKETAPDVIAIEEFVKARHQKSFFGCKSRIIQQKENIKKLEEQIAASNDPGEKEKLLDEQKKEIAELKKKEEKLPELKKRIETIEKYIKGVGKHRVPDEGND